MSSLLHNGILFVFPCQCFILFNIYVYLTHAYTRLNVISNVTLLSSNTERFSCRHEEAPTKGCSVFVCANNIGRRYAQTNTHIPVNIKKKI